MTSFTSTINALVPFTLARYWVVGVMLTELSAPVLS